MKKGGCCTKHCFSTSPLDMLTLRLHPQIPSAQRLHCKNAKISRHSIFMGFQVQRKRLWMCIMQQFLAYVFAHRPSEQRSAWRTLSRGWRHGRGDEVLFRLLLSNKRRQVYWKAFRSDKRGTCGSPAGMNVSTLNLHLNFLADSTRNSELYGSTSKSTNVCIVTFWYLLGTVLACFCRQSFGCTAIVYAIACTFLQSAFRFSSSMLFY